MKRIFMVALMVALVVAMAVPAVAASTAHDTPNGSFIAGGPLPNLDCSGNGGGRTLIAPDGSEVINGGFGGPDCGADGSSGGAGVRFAFTPDLTTPNPNDVSKGVVNGGGSDGVGGGRCQVGYPGNEGCTPLGPPAP
jgi:hypothetical protein